MTVRILIGDCRERLRELPDASAHCCVTSPPYFGLRDYGHEGQMGLEPTPDEFVAGMVEVFREVRRVLRDDGTLWLNIGDSYTTGASVSDRKSDPKAAGDVSKGMRRIGTPEGMKAKDLIGIPWMLAFALRGDGWYLRQEIIWHKPNPMPESVTDRCTKAHESIFLLSKRPRYHFDADAIAEPAIYSGITGMDASGFKNPMDFNGKHRANPEIRGEQPSYRKRNDRFGGNKHNGDTTKNSDGSIYTGGDGSRNKRSVWTVATQPYSEAHFATYPPALIEPCILAGCPSGGTVLDPFGGAGTTGLVADRLGRDAILIELNAEYAALAERRLSNDGGMFADVRAA